MTVRLLGARVS